MLCSGVDMVRVIGSGVAVNNGEVVLDESVASAEPSASTWEEMRCSPTLMMVSSWCGVDASGLPLLLTFFFIGAAVDSQLSDTIDIHSFFHPIIACSSTSFEVGGQQVVSSPLSHKNHSKAFKRRTFPVFWSRRVFCPRK